MWGRVDFFFSPVQVCLKVTSKCQSSVAIKLIRFAGETEDLHDTIPSWPLSLPPSSWNIRGSPWERRGKAEFPPGTGGVSELLLCPTLSTAPTFKRCCCPKPGSLALNHLHFGGFVPSRIHSLGVRAEMVLGGVEWEPSAEKWSSQEGDAQANQLFAAKTTERALKGRAGFKFNLKQTPRKRAGSAICKSKCGSPWAGAQEAGLDGFLHSSARTR